MLSLITAWTDEETRASTFGFAQIVEGIGRMCGDPILLRIFARSMGLDGILMGLPFFVASVRFVALPNLPPPHTRTTALSCSSLRCLLTVWLFL